MYKKKKQKAKFKLRLEFLGILIAVVLMITLSIVLRLDDEKTKFSNMFAEVGSSLSSDHVYVEMNYDELTNHIANSDDLVFVYFGSTECSSCVTEITTVNSRADYWDVEEVIYFDATFTLEEVEEDSTEEKELKELMANYEEKLGVSLETTPALWVFENGEVIFDSNDYLNDDEDGMTLSWSQIADRAFCINLPEYSEEI